MIGETVTIIRSEPDGEDSMGNPITSTSEIDVPDCKFAPGPSAEASATFGARTESDGTLYAPNDAAFLSSDLIRIRGELYVADGEPQQWDDAGVVLSVKRGS